MKVSSVGIIGAMQIEIDAILGELENKTERRFGGLTFTSGTLAGVEVSVALCAPGKVNAAIAAQAMIDRLGPELILNIGVAGGIGKDVHIGDVVIAASCVEYDFDTSALDGCPAGEMSLPGFEKPLRFLPVNGELAQVLAHDSETVDFLTFAQSSAQKVQQLLKTVLPQLAQRDVEDFYDCYDHEDF